MNELLDRIVVDPQIMAGKPVIRGTRITVDLILDLLATGMKPEEIAEMLECRGIKDIEVVEVAKAHNKIIVTMDKDFGYMAISQNPPGLVLLRLRDPRTPSRVRAILRALELGEKLYGYITVMTETIIRRRPISPNLH